MMLVSDFVSALDKVKNFAKESSVFELAKNVRIQSDETSVQFYCCDGESCIWQSIKQGLEQSIYGDFCIDVFTLVKLLKSLPQNLEMKIVHSLRNDDVKISGKSFNVKLKALPETNVLLIDNHCDWADISVSLLDNLKTICSMAHTEDRPIAFVPDDSLIHHASQNAVVYKMFEGKDLGINKFSISPSVTEKMFVDTFSKIHVTDRHIHMKNESCEVMIPQTHIPVLNIKPLIANAKILHVCKVVIDSEELKAAYNAISKIKEINKLTTDGVSLAVSGNEAKLVFYDSDFTVSCVNESGVQTNIRFTFETFKALASLKGSRTEDELAIFFSETKNDSMLVATRGNGVAFIGGLLR